jgi:hypothetical protein
MAKRTRIYDGPGENHDRRAAITIGVDAFLRADTAIEVSTQLAGDGSYCTDVLRLRGAGLDQIVVFAERDQLVRLRACLDEYLVLAEPTPAEWVREALAVESVQDFELEWVCEFRDGELVSMKRLGAG